MTQPPLRLVFDQGKHVPPMAMDLPPGNAALHIHLHLATTARQEPLEALMPPAAAVQGRTTKRRWRPFMLWAAGVVAATVAFDLGARWGEGHARAIAVLQAPPPLPAYPSELPANLRQQLAQPPTVTPPPERGRVPNAADPFGLQH